MAERRLRFTAEARRCIRGIREYIARENPAAAQRVAEGIHERAQVLKAHPEIGFRLNKEDSRSLRALLYGHYRIVYRIEDGDLVTVIGVFHGAMDLAGRFDGK